MLDRSHPKIWDISFAPNQFENKFSLHCTTESLFKSKTDEFVFSLDIPFPQSTEHSSICKRQKCRRDAGGIDSADQCNKSWKEQRLLSCLVIGSILMGCISYFNNMPSYDCLTWIIYNAPGKIMDFLNILEKLDETRKIFWVHWKSLQMMTIHTLCGKRSSFTSD